MNLLIFVCLYTQELEKLKKENTELLRTIEANETQVVIYFQKQLNVLFSKRDWNFFENLKKSVSDWRCF